MRVYMNACVCTVLKKKTTQSKHATPDVEIQVFSLRRKAVQDESRGTEPITGRRPAGAAPQTVPTSPRDRELASASGGTSGVVVKVHFQSDPPTSGASCLFKPEAVHVHASSFRRRTGAAEHRHKYRPAAPLPCPPQTQPNTHTHNPHRASFTDGKREQKHGEGSSGSGRRGGGGRGGGGDQAPDGGGERHRDARGGVGAGGRAGGAVPARLPGAVVLVAAPDGAPRRAGLPVRGARPPRLRRHRGAGRRRVLLRLPRRRRRRRAARRPRPPQGVRGGARLGRHHRVVPVPLPAGPGDGARQHQRRLHAPRLHPLRRRRRQDHRLLQPSIRPNLLHLPLPGARGGGEGVRAGAREAPHDADPQRPLHRARGGRQGDDVGALRRRCGGAPAVAHGGRHRLLRRGVREDGLHGRHQLLPQHGPELGAGGAVGGRQGGGADQVHRRGRRPDVPLRRDPGLPAQGRVQGRRAAAGGGGRRPRRRALHPAGAGAGGQRPHPRLHRQVLKKTQPCRACITFSVDQWIIVRRVLSL